MLTLNDSGDLAVERFCSGYNCAQSTALAFAEALCLDEKTIIGALSGFGGGIGGMRETCGAITGMVFVLGLANGGYEANDADAKTAFYARVREAVGEFTGQFGTINCGELLLKANCIAKPDPSVRNAEYYAKRPCAHFVRLAAEIASKRA
jgi:C_GCAxxG_C_C family probable redox protein